MSRPSLLPVFLVPSLLLLIPGGAMLFKVEGWAWGPGSFVVAWVLLTGCGLTYRLITQAAATTTYRVATGLGLTTGLVLLWVNGAVSLIGSENNPANLLYPGVVAVGAVGAALARLHPLGMSRALLATALAQFLVPVLALVFWPADFSPGLLPVFGFNFCFVLLFAGAALLFRRAAAQARRPAT